MELDITKNQIVSQEKRQQELDDLENLTLQEDSIKNTSFSAKDIKRTRKILKKAGVPKEYWFVEILDKEKNILTKYWL